ncbi:MAG: acyltransferase [Mastigocladus sp. ERB_26_2]
MSQKRLNLIQVFRGVAAILVVFAHTDLIFNQNLNQDFLFKIFTFGGSGVDFFFVLSGFIIFYVHRYEIGKPNKLKSFLIKRITRIYPLYWVILLSKISASLFFVYESDISQRSMGEFFKAFLLFPLDRHILSTSFLGVSWTLTFEVQFYILFGLLIGLKPKLARPIIATWLLGVILHFIGVIELPENNLFLQYLFADYNLEFVMGFLAAYVLLEFLLKSKINWEMLLISLGVFMYTLSAINYFYKFIETSPVMTFGISSTLLVLGATSLELKKIINVPNLLLYIGNASYSIFLMHGFFINNVTKILNKLLPDIFSSILILNILGVIIAIISIICGYIIYMYLEKPLLSIFKPKVART